MARQIPPFRGLLAVFGLLAAMAAAPARAALPQTPLSSTAAAALLMDWHQLLTQYPAANDKVFIAVDVARQQLYFFRNGVLADTWPVSTASRGTGERYGSFETPLGVFEISGKIGAGLPAFAVLDRHGPTGGIARPVFTPDDPAANEMITTRILTLTGLEPGWNEGGDVDTRARHIYIHGTADLGQLGQPASKGCIQMAPGAVIRLFRAVQPGTIVLIIPGPGMLETIPGAPAIVADRDED